MFYLFVNIGSNLVNQYQSEFNFYFIIKNTAQTLYIPYILFKNAKNNKKQLNQMLSQYAYARLQSTEGEQFFIHTIPAVISSRKFKDNSMGVHGEIECLPITGIFNSYVHHGIVFYDDSSYFILPITPISVDDENAKSNQVLIDQLSKKTKQQIEGQISTIIDNSKNYQTFSLKQVSKIVFHADKSQAFYFCLPVNNPQRNFLGTRPINSGLNQNNNTHISTGTKWSNDDHEQLKRLLLLYGYDRWKQIQRSAGSMGSKLDQKPLSQIKAYSNGYLRALGLALPEDETNLKLFLQKLIQQHEKEFQQHQPNLKDWQPHIQLPQRAVQYTKRLQLLYRVKNLIRKYRDDALRGMQVRDRRKINWDGLLNFIPLGLLFGQRPAVWWAKKHDIDLLLGIYKYGYANYINIRAARQYCFAQLQKTHAYQDFPVADNLTRRLKKLINTIVKIQQNQGEIDFQQEASSEQDQKAWSDIQKRTLFNILVDYGVPVGTDNKSNWSQLKQKVKQYIKQFNKTPAQVQKMVSRLRWNCQEIISDQKMKEQNNNTNNSNGVFKLTYESANKFIKNINILEFIRKSILSMQEDSLKVFLKQVQQKSPSLPHDHAACIQGKHDSQLLTHVNKNGLVAYAPAKLNESKVFARMQWLCQIYKIVKQKLQNTKKKYKTFDQSTKKRPKFQISKDKDGNIKFPISVNPSLTLVATGRICTLSNYHSEHNLFPIGYISVRTHASMFHKGQRAKYRCQILEGDNRPIYKVTPQQDPDHPIIKDSSTGCWVYICQKVNDLQDVKKQKVTISGTQRFGLLQQNVVRLLQDLPQAQKCTKYKFKKNIPKQAE